METHVLVTFSNFSLSSNDTTNPIQMELSYESKKIKFTYPQSEPLKLNFTSKFIQDKVSLILTTTIEVHNKKKISYRADATLNKTIFSDNNKTIYEKNITMIPIESMKEINMKDNKKIGKIFMQIQLLDQLEEWKKNFKLFNKKKTGTKLKNPSISNNDSVANQKNAHLNNSNSNISSNNKQQTSAQKIKKDTISEVMPDPVLDDLGDESKTMDELNKLINLDEINKLKDIVKNDYKKIFPNDINALKTLNENLYQKYNQLNAKYNELLNGMNNTNENIRNKAIEYYNEYKDLKKIYDKKMNELNKRKKNTDNELLKNKQENDNIKNNLQKYYDEKDYLFQKITSSPEVPAIGENQKNQKIEENLQNLVGITQILNNNDTKMIRDALKKISSLGYDILDGLNISEEEKKLLSALLGDSNDNNPIGNDNAKGDLDEKKNKREEEVEDDEGNDIEADKEDYDLSNQIVGLIERDVNDLYMRKLIEQVKIDQIDAITYSFKGNTKTKEVEFKIENGNLFCNTGESFTVWLISNFSL